MFYPVLGRGGGAKSFGPAISPFFSPVITDRSLNGRPKTVVIMLQYTEIIILELVFWPH